MEEESIEESLRRRAKARRRRIYLLILSFIAEGAGILGFVAGYLGAIDWFLGIASLVTGLAVGLIAWTKMTIIARHPR